MSSGLRSPAAVAGEKRHDLRQTVSRLPHARAERPQVRGKFLVAGASKLWLRGVTYGAFRPDPDGNEYHDLARIDADFAQMAASGMNAVRIPHTMPPRALLDLAALHGLRVMVGLSAEQWVGYLIDGKAAPDVEAIVRAKVRSCARHPALLCYALGNEIPAQVVRWLGPRRIERYLERLHRVVKAEDPDGLVTYVNYPTTEYLRLPFLDLVCFNVYLESRERLEAYLARLHNVAGDRPLVLSEIGLDSLRNGERMQSHVLEWQVRTAFAAGCAGTFVFAWTDEWYRAGEDVDDWRFGLTDAQRTPKPALRAIRNAYAEVPFPAACREWPLVSVIVCTYNGGRTIRDCLEGLRHLDYPRLEVIVVDDGSTDDTGAIAAGYDVRLVRTANQGLGAARNVGLAAARGEMVAYLDDDARPDPHWIQYLVDTLLSSSHVAVGGPNVAPPDDGRIAECIANSPGGPTHVLLSDREAEHIPGCNMAFRRDALVAIGGFDPQFRVAGDDVDVCWQLQKRGWTLGFSPAALVWHHRRRSVRAYWRQQRGYGRAEALLEAKWPEKYNSAGHPTWTGRVYGRPLRRLFGQGRIYHGTWGSAAFQSLYEPAASVLGALPLLPEWYLVIATLAALSALGMVWRPLVLFGPLLAGAVGASLVQACLGAAHASFRSVTRSRRARLGAKGLTALLHLLQPLARLVGRLEHGLTPWRRRLNHGIAAPWPRALAALQSGPWQEPAEKLRAMEAALRASGALVRRGGAFDRWDLEVLGGLLAGVRMLLAIEDHGPRTQLVRVRTWPTFSPVGVGILVACAALGVAGTAEQAWLAGAVFGLLALGLALRNVQEAGHSMAAVLATVERDASEP